MEGFEIITRSITDDIRNDFKRLQGKDRLLDMIEYLSCILTQGDNDNMLNGFCYWNISDSYAMLRKPDAQYTNHLNFYKLLETMDPKYIFWLVCDATQRFTLELGGYDEFWWGIYKTTVQLNYDISGIEHIAFEAHNAALSINPKVKSTPYNLQIARDNFKNLIKACNNTESIVFYKLVYSSACLKAFGDEEYDILKLCNIILPWLKEDSEDSLYAVGEWERLNSERTHQNMARVGINRAVNAFIDVGKKEIAKVLYDESLKRKKTKNAYIENRI